MEQHLEETPPPPSSSPSPSPSPSSSASASPIAAKKRGRPKKAYKMSRRGEKTHTAELRSEQTSSAAKCRRKRKGLLSSSGRRRKNVEREKERETKTETTPTITRCPTKPQTNGNGEAPTEAPVPEVEVDLSSVEAKLGQFVHGVVDGSFDAGFLVTVRVGEADPTVFRGIVFGPGMTIPLTRDHMDVAPKARRRSRNKLVEEDEPQLQPHLEPEPRAETEAEDNEADPSAVETEKGNGHVGCDDESGIQTSHIPATHFQQPVCALLVPPTASPACAAMPASHAPYTASHDQVSRLQSMQAMGFRAGPLPPAAYGSPIMAYRSSSSSSAKYAPSQYPLQIPSVPASSVNIAAPSSQICPSPSPMMNPRSNLYMSMNMNMYPNASSHATQASANNNTQAYYPSQMPPAYNQFPFPAPPEFVSVTSHAAAAAAVPSSASSVPGLQVPHT